MCSLIAIRGRDPRHAWFVAANRDEDPARPTAPPGLNIGQHRKILCPRDKRAGGTWIGVNDGGRIAALTNAPGLHPVGSQSRGLLPLTALDAPDLESARRQVRSCLEQWSFPPFRLLLLEGEHALLFQAAEEGLEEKELHEDLIFLTDRFGPGEARVPELERWLQEREEEDLDIDAHLDHLLVVLATGLGLSPEGPFPLRTAEGPRRTVSATLLAVGLGGPEDLRILYAPGDPRTTKVRDYSVLAKRLFGDAGRGG